MKRAPAGPTTHRARTTTSSSTALKAATAGSGYLGYTYYEENADRLNAVEIDNGDGCVAPSAETVADGTYQPLARELFIYPSIEMSADNEAAKAFAEFYVENDATIAEAAQYIPLSDEQKSTLDSELADFQSAVDAVCLSRPRRRPSTSTLLPQGPTGSCGSSVRVTANALCSSFC